MKLFFDVETTGRPEMRDAPHAPHQPRIVQLAMALYDYDGGEHAAMSAVIRPDGWTIPDDAAAVHGITTARALQVGVPLGSTLTTFCSYLTLASELIAHNIEFDLFLLTGELLRLGEPVEALSLPRQVCTMLDSTDLCRLPGGRRGWKWPRLEEAYWHFYERRLNGAHDAMIDVRACAAVHFAIIGKPLADHQPAAAPALAADAGRLSNGFTWHDLAECARREVRQRRRVYPGLVQKGTMDQATADREIAMMGTLARVMDNANIAELPLS